MKDSIGMGRLLLIVAGIAPSLLFSACSQSGPSPQVQTRPGEAVPPADPVIRSEMPPGIPGGPDTFSASVLASGHSSAVSIKRALAAVHSGRLDVAFDFLPGEYQRDLDELIQRFSRRMDPEIWSRLFEVAATGVEVLREQKALILELIEQPGREAEQAQLAANWDGLVAALTEVMKSDLSNIQRLQQATSRGLLDHVGNPLLVHLLHLGPVAGENPLERLAKVDVEVVEEQGDRATLLFHVPGEASQKIDFVQVGGRWIPQSLADSWEPVISDVRTEVDRFTDDWLKARKPKILASLQGIEDGLESMLDARTSEELQSAAFPVLLQGTQLVASLRQLHGPQDGVTIITTSLSDRSAETRLLKDLERLSDNPQRCTYEASKRGEQFVINLRPVADPVAFAEKIDFAAKKSLDVETRTLRLELKTP